MIALGGGGVDGVDGAAPLGGEATGLAVETSGYLVAAQDATPVPLPGNRRLANGLLFLVPPCYNPSPLKIEAVSRPLPPAFLYALRVLK